MPSIVANATPLIYLAKLGRLTLLKQLFGEVISPEEVRVEVIDKGKGLGKPDAYIVEKAVEEGWLKILKATPIKVPFDLEQGETAALSLAKQQGLDILLDEVSARTAARLLDVTPRGTIFVLLSALKRKMITLNEFLELLSHLVQHGFRLKEEVYLEAIRKAQEIVD